MKSGNVNGITSTDVPRLQCSLPSNAVSSTFQPQSQHLYAAQAMQLLEEGNFQAALQVLNLCLGDADESETSDLEAQVEDLITKNQGDKLESSTSGSTDDCSLIEKRCLVNMRLKRFNKVIHDAKKMLDYSGENSVAYKCLLAALCKMRKLDQANEVIRLWQKNSPRDLDMMECRTKLESLMVAVKNGIEASDAFSDVEELLGLNYDWLLLRKSKDPQWRYRPLPTSSRCSFVLCLQYRFGHCSLGEKCPDAHGEAELEEWKKRFEIENVSRKINSLRIDDGSTYIKELLSKIQVQSGSKKLLCEDDMDQIKVSCKSPLSITVQQRKFKKFTWKFTARTLKPLTYVCLLHDHHRQYFHISSCSFVGPNDTVVLNQSGKAEMTSQVVVPQLSEAALAIAGGSVNTYTYKVKVVFTPEVYGNFRQAVIFDVGDDLKVVRNVTADVVPPPDSDIDGKSGGNNETSSSPVDMSKGFRNNIPWNFGNAEMVDANTGEKVPSEKLGFALMSSSCVTKSESFMENTKDPLSKTHYKERMRFLLTQEERSRQEILAKYNVTTNVHLSEKYVVNGGYNEGMTRYAIDGALYGRINLFRDISEDTAVGRLILRSCNAILLTKSEESRKRDSKSSKIRVYFCPLSDKSKNSVFLDLGKTCVSELQLKDGDVIQFDIQFQLDRTAFIEQKKIIDQLEERHLNMLFPDLEINCNIPWSPIKQWDEPENSKYRLNPKQKEALIAITAENCKTPPILVIGPFGSGKTFTLAQCIRKILTQQNTRVMVCTHSNSAADLYIKEYLDSWVKEGFPSAKPLRIYYEMRNLSSVHPTVLQYCTIEAMKFRAPTYDEVLNHRVIVVTLSTSYLLMEMNLPKDTFSHILLDEAAQAMESEAITPLMSAGKYTKLVLAGDHFQLSPELFSEEARNIHPSLLERLHALYPDTHPCKLMLCENYRSHSAIIQFVSDAFYTKKLECAKSQPVHDNFFPLTFFAARGEDVQDSESTSYYNMAEVFELTEKISELISSWPQKWGDYRDENAIGVLTPYADQVTRIRTRLRKKGLHSVSVERVFNVQGKQFRAVFLSTVRTFRPWVRILPEAVGNEVDLGFFSSPKLLNTALTRAQSLVAVVGDPVSLCSVGKCRRIWDDYIRICHESKSLFGMTFLQLKQSILGVEMRLTWGLNPLANEFQPQKYINRVPAATVAPVSISSVQCTVATNVPHPQHLQYYSKGRPRPTIIAAVDPSGVHYPAAPYHPEMATGLLPPPHPVIPNQHTVYARPPFHGGVGIVPSFPTYAPPPASPWGQQNIGLPLSLPPNSQNFQWVNNANFHAATNIRPATVQHRPIHYPGTVMAPAQTFPNVHGTGNTLTPQVGPYMNPILAHPLSANEAQNAVHSNTNYAVKNPVMSQSHFAAGQPLFRRPRNDAHGINAVPGSDERSSINQFHSYDHHQQLYQHQGQPYQQKLTQEELNFITRALEHHASSGEPFFGDLQSLRSKLMHAVSTGDIIPPSRQAVSQTTAVNYPSMNENYSQISGINPTAISSTPATAGSGIFVPIPQKSPVHPSDKATYNSGFHDPAPSSGMSGRVWPSPNTFPAINESIKPINTSHLHTQQPFSNDNTIQRNRGQSYLDPNNMRDAYNQPGSTNMTSILNNVPQGLTGRPLSSFNNNTVPSQYEYSYQSDVGGLKAQLSGGLRQGFSDRSAFSRVNGTQDVDIITDSSGLGRSYANVVKAAVTAAVGAVVSTSVVSNPANMARPPNPGVPVPSNPYSSLKYLQGASAHGHFGP